ncbi:MAG: ABC transporter ATP-binding protein [Betaproteobacteria bacterium]|nr:MAG: ABC transporter ATP-binding protein [Betaproteobacteria bacterium]
MLTVSGLDAFYGSSHVLFGIDLGVGAGEVVVLLGRNGAGKTTTLKSVMGVLDSRSGSIRFKGAEIGALESDEICRRGMGYVPEDCRVFRGLSVLENLEAGRRAPRHGAAGAEAWDEERIFQLFPDLRTFQSRRADSLSGGQQRMLAIARTLMGNPSLLLLDEPSEGLAPLVVQDILEQLRKLKQTGVTILLSEQNLKFSLQLADRVYIIEKGTIKYEGTAQSLADDRATREAYLMV